MQDAQSHTDSTKRPTLALLSINYAPEPTGIAVYSTGMAEYLAAQGFPIVVYTRFAYYPAWRKSKRDRGKLFASEVSAQVALRRCYLYVPRRPTALRRIMHELSFCLSVALRYAWHKAPNVTIIVSPPLLLGALLGGFARMRGSQVILHIQDLQPDAAIDLGMLKVGRLAGLLFALEKASYAAAHFVTSISEAMLTKIQGKGVPPAKTFLFKNWADSDQIKPLDATQSLRQAWQLEDRFVVLYSGNMGVKQGLDTLLDAALLMRADHQVVFVIVGDGGQKNELIARAHDLGLSNVVFMPPVEKDQLVHLLATADVSVIPQRAGASDLVLPSKLGNLFASQRPVIVAAQQRSELALIVQESGGGLVIPPDDPQGLADAVQSLRERPALRAVMGDSGRSYALSHMSRESILGNFAKKLAAIA